MHYDKDEILCELNEVFDRLGSFSSYDCDTVSNNLNLDKYTYDYGATKFVLIPRDGTADYVIKIPFTGLYDDWAEEYTDLKYAGNADGDEWDYCETELERYDIACKTEFKDCFAKIEYIGCVGMFPVYVQERCVTLDKRLIHDDISHSDEERKDTRNLLNNYWGIDIDWLVDFRHYFGTQFLENFIAFLEKQYWDNDLRSCNIGYINDRPVLIDYSGFYD